jgi:mannosyltransferase
MTAPPTDGTGLRGHPDGPGQVPGVTTGAPAASRIPVAAVERRGARDAADRVWMQLLPSAVTACVLAIGIAVPSYWRDEAATVAAVRRPAGALLQMLGRVDAVHGAYYLLIWPVSYLFGTNELALRLPSLIAMSAAAGVVAATGRRLVSPAAGLAAGLVFAVVPSVTEYGQMARSYALVLLAAAVASYALVRALEEDAARSRWLCYSASLALLGVLNIFGLLLIPAHAITMLAGQRGLGKGPAGLGPSRVPRRWLAAAGAALAVTSPLIVLGYRQRGQISWVTYPGVGSLRNAAQLLGPPWMSVTLLVMTVAGLSASIARKPSAWASAPTGSARWRASAPFGVIALCLPWLVIPATLLLLASALVTPVYTFRYIVFCVPAGATLAGTGLAAIAGIARRRLAGPRGAAAIFVLITALGLGQQVQYRQPGGHGDDIRGADEQIAASWKPGDAVYYPGAQLMPLGAAYPDGLSWLRAVQIAQPAVPSGTLAGTTVPVAVVRQRLARSPRFWIVQVDGLSSQWQLLYGLYFQLARTWQVSDIWLQLYVPSATAFGYPGPSAAGSNAWISRRVS